MKLVTLRRTLFAVLTIFVSCWIPVSFATAQPMDSGTSSPDGSVQIRLQQATFDPLLKASPVPPELTWSSIDEQRPQYYLVQFHGPILSDWREQLEQAGAEVLDYIPDCRRGIRRSI